MENFANTFDLSPEQRDTARLLDELLGQAIAARYEDFCRLSSGAFAIHAAKPMALHALRELNSMLRSVLAVPMGAVEVLDEDFKERLESARNRLTDLKFGDGAVNEAVKRLLPGTAKTQIERIVTQLGLAADGDIAKKWIALTNKGGAAHGRSFHRSLGVDTDFRADYQEPFDTVIRAVVVALRGRYTALMRRAEVLASSTDYRKAVKAFAIEIPGAMPLQWHFFQHLKTGDWLPHLIKEGLIAEPLAPLESAGEARYSARGHSGIICTVWLKHRRQAPAGMSWKLCACSRAPITLQFSARASSYWQHFPQLNLLLCRTSLSPG